MKNNTNSFANYQAENQIATLFNVDISVIYRHIKNIFNNKVIDEKVVEQFRTTTKHGAIEDKIQTKKVEHFNLDIILVIGYRINSLRVIQFKI